MKERGTGRRRAGLALLIVVGVLGILAVLATAFVTMAQLERKASRQRLHATKAELLARSGIEDALARLGAFQDADGAISCYGGEDWDNSNTLNGFEGAAEIYRTGFLNRDDCPARHALRPSFFVRSGMDVGADGLPAPVRTQVDSRTRGYSGSLAGDQVPGGNQYVLKVTPEAGIWVNGGSPAGYPAYDAVLRRILGNLAEALDRENGGANDGLPTDRPIGWALVDQRPPGGWRDMAQIRQMARTLGTLLEAKVLALLPYVTTRAWVDTRTLKPETGTLSTTANLHTWFEIKLAVNAAGTPGRGMPVLEPRAPVNLAWARHRWPVLVALMGGLKGLYLNEASSSPAGVKGDYIGGMKQVEIALDWSQPQDACRNVASALAARTAPLDTWDAWDAFCDTLTTDLGSNVYPTLPAMRSLLKANFNPNSRLNKFNPNRSMWNLVDKQDLLPDGYSTEFVLEPVHAHEVESVGRVLSPDGRLLASRTLVCEVSGPEVVRLSTQKEFVCADLGSLDKAGDETTMRIPGQASPFLPASQGAGVTWGQALPGLDGKGTGVQAYPQPYVDVDPAWNPGVWDLRFSTAEVDYDGSLQSATVETPRTPGITMLARYTADLDLDVSRAYDAGGDVKKRRNQPDTEQVTYVNGIPPDPSDPDVTELRHGLLDTARPNTLYPDGCYAEVGRTPGYFDRDNANGIQGFMSFWFKPNHHAVGDYLDQDATLTRGGRLLRPRQLVKWSNYYTGPGGGPVTWSRDQFFAVSYGQVSTFLDIRAYDLFFECGNQDPTDPTDVQEQLDEHWFTTPVCERPPHRWRLLTAAWWLTAPDKDAVGKVCVDDGGVQSGLNAYTISVGNDPSKAVDLTNDDMYGDYAVHGGIPATWPHLIFLGRRGYHSGEFGGIGLLMDNVFGQGADATFDEFAMYEGDRNDAVATASQRFPDGRYYKESAYPASGGLLVPVGPPSRTAAEYFSAPLDLHGGRLRMLAWTQVVPPGLKSPDDPGEDGRIEMELSADSVTGPRYAPDADGGSIDTTFRNSAMTRVGRRPAGPFRLHAVFRPNLDQPLSTPILDPLALDDVTLLYDPPGGAAILRWREGAP